VVDRDAVHLGRRRCRRRSLSQDIDLATVDTTREEVEWSSEEVLLADDGTALCDLCPRGHRSHFVNCWGQLYRCEYITVV
jgi:hypothetical protein